MGMVAAGHALVRARQPREQARSARSGAARCRSATASPRRSSSSARETAGVPRRRSREFIDGLVSPLRPRRRPAGRRARRAARRLPRPRVRAGPQLRAVRRHDRRDRRVRPAGALPVGGGLPRPRDGVYGHTPDARARVGQQHDLPGHRLRVRRQADRAALPGARARRRAGRAGLVRAGQAVPDAPSAPAPAPRARRAGHRPTCSGSAVVETRTTAGSPSGRRTPPRALEVMSRFAVDPRWLLYLPPTMAPVRDVAARPACWSTRPRRSPRTAADGVDAGGVRGEAHGLARGRRWCAATPTAAEERFGARTARPARSTPGPAGRSSTPPLTEELLDAAPARRRERRALGRARHRLAAARRRAAAVVAQGRGPAARPVRRGRRRGARVLPAASRRWSAAAARGVDVADLLDRTAARAADADAFTDAYRRYCWPTDGLDGVRLAPFQVLASEGRRPTTAGPRLAPRRRRPAGRRDARTWSARPGGAGRPARTTTPVAAAGRWWQELTAAGGEGMVVKPLANLVRAGTGSPSRASRSAAGSTCGSSTARVHRARRTSSGCASATSATSVAGAA